MDDGFFDSAKRLAAAISAGQVSALEVVETLLARIEVINPQINAVVEVAPDALARARQADSDLAQGLIHGPLHGVPFTVKDVFETAGLASDLDQRLRRRKPPQGDAVVVARMREAGAILLAKTNCPPNGSGRDTENALYGRTLNPYDFGNTPGGSSGGEAALIAAGGSPIGLGSDTSGGLRLPAHYCGIAALKPTSGRVPNTGAYNQPGGLSDPRTQIGPLARTVDDLALLLPIIAGADNYDSGVTPMPWRNPQAVRPTRLTVAYFSEDPASPVSAETGRALGAAAQALARAGVDVESALPADLVGAGRELDSLWQDMAGAPGRTLVEMYAMWDRFRSHLLDFMAPYDALLCPVAPHAAPPFQERDHVRFDYTVPFSLTGYPAVVVRAGADQDQMPIGVQVVARPWREDVALVLARILEQEFGGWQRPPL